MNENDVFEMIGPDGETESFAFLATVEHNGQYYLVAEPQSEEFAPDETDDEDVEVPVIIMHCQFAENEDDDDVYTVVDDEEILDAVFNKFLAQIEEDDDADDLETDLDDEE